VLLLRGSGSGPLGRWPPLGMGMGCDAAPAARGTLNSPPLALVSFLLAFLSSSVLLSESERMSECAQNIALCVCVCVCVRFAFYLNVILCVCRRFAFYLKVVLCVCVRFAFCFPLYPLHLSLVTSFFHFLPPKYSWIFVWIFGLGRPSSENENLQSSSRIYLAYSDSLPLPDPTET
jgi:hypothetical protein